MAAAKSPGSKSVRIPCGRVEVDGDLDLPPDPEGIVVFAHGSGSSRLSPRNMHVAGTLRDAGLGTLLMDLLTAAEDRDPAARFDIPLLAERLRAAFAWLRREPAAARLRTGCFGASTGAAAALIAAAADPAVAAVVSRGGRVDLAGDALRAVRCPTLFIVGGEDAAVLELNQRACRELQCEKKLHVVPGAGHLFEERGALDEVAREAARWFATHLREKQAR